MHTTLLTKKALQAKFNKFSNMMFEARQALLITQMDEYYERFRAATNYRDEVINDIIETVTRLDKERNDIKNKLSTLVNSF